MTGLATRRGPTGMLPSGRTSIALALSGILAAGAAAAVVAAACAASRSAGGPSEQPHTTDSGHTSVPADRVAGWRADLATLVTARESIHPDPWFNVPRDEYVAAVDAVAARVPELTDNELMVEATRLAAMPTWGGRDGRGGIYPWFEGGFTTHMYPLRLYRFADGVFVVDALDPYEDLVGGEVVALAGRPIEDVLAAVEPLVARDNEQALITHAPRYLLVAEVLEGLGVVAGTDRAGLPADDRAAPAGAAHLGGLLRRPRPGAGGDPGRGLNKREAAAACDSRVRCASEPR